MDDLLTDLNQLLIGRGFIESFFHCFLVEFLKTFHSGTVRHGYHTLHYLLLVLADVFQPEEEQ